MRKITRLSCLLLNILFCSLLLTNSASAQSSGYDISAYDVDVVIGSDNVYHITETISVNFRVPSHGIYRYIPLRQEMEWNVGGKTRRALYNTKVLNISVQDEIFQTYYESGNLVIKIGDPGRYAPANKVYRISYDHALGNDKIDSLDFVYYNLIGTLWDCNISNVSFSLSLPKDFDEGKLFFYSGDPGATTAAPVNYDVDNNTITGTLNQTLRPGEGLTVQLELPEGYFEVPPGFPWQSFFIMLSAAFAVIAAILFVLFGRDPVLPRPVEFNPPEGITPAEAGYIIDTNVEDRDIVSLIIYWASRGYISIEQVSEDDYRLIKLKELHEDSSDYERVLFGGIFNNRENVLISELRENVYKEFSSAKLMVEEHFQKKERRLYSSFSVFLGKLMTLMAGLLIWGTLFYTIFTGLYSLEVALIFSLGATLVVMLPLISIKKIIARWHGIGRMKRISGLVLSIIVSLVVLIVYVAFMYTQALFLAGIVVAAASAFLSVISVFMRKRTRRGSELLGRVLGFRNFLETAEKSRIELLVAQNPSYFYDVLPYAYVFGISDKWARKFEGIAMSPPSWYVGSYGAGMFTPLLFYMLMFNSLATMQSTMISRPVVAQGGIGGGGFGGGGFSSGGFGGGGGGRW